MDQETELKEENAKKIQDAALKLLRTNNPDSALLDLLNSDSMSVDEKVQTLRTFIAMLMTVVTKNKAKKRIPFKGFIKTFKPVLIKAEDLID